MMAMCSKFGTSDLGVAVGDRVGAGVCEGNKVAVGKSVMVGAGAGLVGAATGALAQAARISKAGRVGKSFVFMVVSGRLYSREHLPNVTQQLLGYRIRISFSANHRQSPRIVRKIGGLYSRFDLFGLKLSQMRLPYSNHEFAERISKNLV